MLKDRGYTPEELINYISKPLKQEQLELIYKANVIENNKSNLFKEFILSLFHIVKDTYPGDDVMEENDQEKHYNFCWEKNINNFKEENLNFKEEDEIFYYLKETVFDTFYHQEDKEKEMINLILFYERIMNLNCEDKTQSEADIMIELYKAMFKSYFIN